MSQPITREDFKAHCLRALGDPVIEIEVSDDQVEDRIEEALTFYQDYHYNGMDKVYYSHQITANTVADKYITLPETIVDVTRLFPIGGLVTGGSGNMFSIQYQIALNDMWDLLSSSIVPYTMMRNHLQLLDETLIGSPLIRYNQHRNKLYIDMDWTRVNVGDYILAEAYEITDPDTYTDVWSDRWLQRYATALIKRQWGQNLSKYDGVQLPGGITFSGREMLDDAEADITALETECRDMLSIPPDGMIG